MVRDRQLQARAMSVEDEPGGAIDTPPSRAALVCIGASTGGPSVLQSLLVGLEPSRCPPVLVTQHLPAGLVSSFVSWLDQRVEVAVRLAHEGEIPSAGCVLVAPDDVHLELDARGCVALTRKPSSMRHRPAVDVMFESIPTQVVNASVAILLTGMGNDGARGLKSLRRAGAFTIVQDPASAPEPSMPAAAIELGAARLIADKSKISQVLDELSWADAAAVGWDCRPQL